MNQQEIDMFIIANIKYFPEKKISFLKDKLKTINEEKFKLISAMKFKDPTALFLISICSGALGLDRFILGEIGMGILKLCTFGGLGILTIFDWCTIAKRTKARNFRTIMSIL